MMSYKACLALGALLVVSFVVSTTAECKDCRGDNLIEIAKSFEKSVKCWLNANNQYLMKLKLQLMEIITEQLKELIEPTTGKVSAKCTTAIHTKVCKMPEENLQADCHIANIYYLARTYDDLEECHGEALQTPLLDLIMKFMKGVMLGWKQVHTEC